MYRNYCVLSVTRCAVRSSDAVSSARGRTYLEACKQLWDLVMSAARASAFCLSDVDYLPCGGHNRPGGPLGSTRRCPRALGLCGGLDTNPTPRLRWRRYKLRCGIYFNGSLQARNVDQPYSILFLDAIGKVNQPDMCSPSQIASMRPSHPYHGILFRSPCHARQVCLLSESTAIPHFSNL